MQRLEASGAVRPLYGSLGVKWLTMNSATKDMFFHDLKSLTFSVHLMMSLPTFFSLCVCVCVCMGCSLCWATDDSRQEEEKFPGVSKPALMPFLRGNAAGRESDHSPAPNSEVKNKCSCTSTPPKRSHAVNRGKFTFHLHHFNLITSSAPLLLKWLLDHLKHSDGSSESHVQHLCTVYNSTCIFCSCDEPIPL